LVNITGKMDRRPTTPRLREIKRSRVSRPALRRAYKLQQLCALGIDTLSIVLI
jgi:hypothetical protein